MIHSTHSPARHSRNETASSSSIGLRRVPQSTGFELSDLRQDRSTDFSPLLRVARLGLQRFVGRVPSRGATLDVVYSPVPAVLRGPERGGRKSALLSMHRERGGG